MRIVLFSKAFFVLVVLSLIAFVLSPMDFLTLAKLIATSALFSIAFVLIYPEIRGIKNGDVVMIINSDSQHLLVTRFGKALNDAKKNSKVKISLGDGTEILGVVQSYEGFITPPRVRILYEEQLVEKWKY